MKIPSQFYPTVDIQALKKEYVGKTLDEIPTPAFIVNRKVMKNNCDLMLERAKKIGADFRAHVKTHKSDSGLSLQLGNDGLSTTRTVVSTLMEAWKLIPSIEKGLIDDVGVLNPISNCF